jgi:UDP-3-O-[3-hydroxymyristoyl] N-acetylglucosamine deacetylase / 3-hydroxyacyl-[acyl-carrier-protein] dehydratase
MQNQKTIKSEVSLKGIGIHTGKRVSITFKPAPPDAGINFIRTDLSQKAVIPANISCLLNASLRPRRTSIGKEDVHIHTIEHIMASLYGLGIDNAYIGIDGPEPPGLDGSAKEIVESLKRTGISEQDTPRKEIAIKEPLWVEDEQSVLVALPGENFSVSYILDYNHAGLRSQYNHFRINPEVFQKDIAPSRTFCLKSEIDELFSQGIGKGASSKNTLIINEDGTTPAKLRFQDEFLRHKILDLIGDIFLTGHFLKSHIIGIKSGHFLNLKMAQLIKERYAREEKPQAAGYKLQAKKPLLDKEQIKEILPHREPFLLIDEIIELGDATAVGIKYVDISDYYFAGHFPERPIMPGVLILEALAQVGGVLMLKKSHNKGKFAYFMAIDNAKFRKAVVPGDKLRLEIEITRARTKTAQAHGSAYVDGTLVCEADLMFSAVV